MATNAVSFNGSTQYGKIDNFAGLDGLDSFTMEWWVKNTSTSVPYSPLCRIDDGTNWFAGMSTENGTGNQGFNMATNYSGTNADGYESSARLTQAAWVQVSLVHDGVLNKTSIFINGVENNAYELQQTGTLILQDSTGMHVMMAVDFTATPDKYFDGAIGGYLRVWNRALNGAEIYARYNKTITAAGINDASLIVNCNFAEGSGTVADNDATAGQDLDFYNTPTWVTGPDLTTASYPNVVYRQVAQSADDAEEATGGGTTDITSSDIEIVVDGAVTQQIGLRFQNVTVPAGATIASAYLRLVGDETQSGGTESVDIYGEDVDDSAAFAASSNNLTGRTKTTAKVDWDSIAGSSPGVIQSSPDIAAIIQEIVDRASWASGNDLSIIFAPGGSNATRTYESWDGQPYSSAMLEVQYTVAAGGAAFLPRLGLLHVG